MSVTKPVECQSDDVVKPAVTCGSSTAPSWTLLTSAHLVATVQQATPVCSTFTIDANGLITLAWNNTTLERDGYTEGDRFVFDPLLLDPDFTVQTHGVEFYVEEVTAFPTAANQPQVGWGLFTAATASGTLAGSAVRLHDNVGTRQMNQLNAASPNAGVGTSVIAGRGRYRSHHHYYGNRAPMGFSYENTSNVWSSALAGATDTGDPANPAYLAFIAGKDSTGNATGASCTMRLYAKIVPRGAEAP